VKEKCCIIANVFPPNMEVCDIQKFYTFTTVENYFFLPELL